MLQAGGRGWEKAEVDNREGVEVLDSISSYKFHKLGGLSSSHFGCASGIA